METSSEVSCEVMDDDDDDTDSPCHQQASCYDVQCQQTFYAQQISALEYARQANEYTKYAVESLVSSPEYQRIYTRCQLCWSIWSEGGFNESCNECGGFAMTRPCPICDGRCGAIWTRDVEMQQKPARRL